MPVSNVFNIHFLKYLQGKYILSYQLNNFNFYHSQIIQSKMTEERPGIVQYADNIKENTNGSIFNAIFFKVLENKGIFEQMDFYMKNIEKLGIAYQLREGKNEKLAKEHRESGNRRFTDDNFVGALSLYNQSIAYGMKADNLSLCYANRSAVYYELGMFEKCLENISMAKKLKYPMKLMPKLNKRAEDARRGLRSSEEIPNRHFDCFSKLTKPASKEQPFIIDCLEGSNLDDVKKRRIRTTSALVTGDIISKELKPVSQLLKPKLLFTHCTYCLSTDAAMSMIPCKLCSTAMFCNDECYKKANDLFHSIECPIIDGIYGMLSESMWLGLRTVLIGISICGTVEKYQDFLVDAATKKVNILEQTFMGSENITEVDDLDRYRAIVNLPVDDEFELEDCVGAAFALKLLTEHSTLINDANIKFMAATLYNSMRIARENALLLEETYSMIGLTNEITFYGRALFPFACNFNLSCAPNFLLLNNKTSMLGVVIRPIPAGGVLYAGLA